MKIIPVIIAGGVGSRLWPVSTITSPKIFLKVNGEYSLLQQTLLRVLKTDVKIDRVITVLNSKIYEEVKTQYELCCSDYDQDNISFEYIIEPLLRNTAPAVLSAIIHVQQSCSPLDIILILPADHIIANQVEFTNAIEEAVIASQQNYIVTLGVKPEYPETGYGYINIDQNAPIIDENIKNVYQVHKFIEKPDLATAEVYYQSNSYLWNTGLFLANIKTWIQSFQQQQLIMYNAMQAIIANSRYENNCLWLDENNFAKLQNLSIDYGIIEHIHNIAVVVCKDLLWSDLGSWRSLANTINTDEHGNCNFFPNDDTIVHDVNDTVIYSTNKKKIVLIGVQDLLIVDHKGCLLIANKSESDKIKDIIKI